MKSMLIDLVKMAGDQARMVMIGLQQPLMPSWVYIDQQGRFHVVGTPWTSDEEKELQASHMRAVMRKQKAIAYSLVVEAWSASAPAGWKPGQTIDKRPRDRVDRKETVIAFATDGQLVEWKTWDTKRDWNERVIALEEQSFNGVQTESWMTQLLK